MDDQWNQTPGGQAPTDPGAGAPVGQPDPAGGVPGGVPTWTPPTPSTPPVADPNAGQQPQTPVGGDTPVAPVGGSQDPNAGTPGRGPTV